VVFLLCQILAIARMTKARPQTTLDNWINGVGSLTGAMVMLLMAPRAGKKSRFQLQKHGAKLRRQKGM
jgi:glucose uptake protein GlcU